MKKTQNYYLLSIIFIFPLFLVFSCHKEDPVKLPSNGELGIITSCNNGIMDGDEIGIDCGGPCGPCDLSQAGDCTIMYSNDESKVKSNDAVASVPFDNNTSSIVNGKYTAIATNSVGDSIIFTFPDSNPMFFQSYNPTAKTSLDTSKVYIEARLKSMPYGGWGSGSTYFYESVTSSESTNPEQRVHLNKINGKFDITFCDLRLKEKSQGSIFSFEGQLVED